MITDKDSIKEIGIPLSGKGEEPINRSQQGVDAGYGTLDQPSAAAPGMIPRLGVAPIDDQATAEQIRRMLSEAMVDVLDVFNFARSKNFNIAWGGITLGPNNRFTINNIDISRHY